MIRNSRNLIGTLLVFLIRKDPRLGQVPTLEGWDRQSACPSGTGLGQAECLSQWDRFGTGKGQKRPVPCPMDRSHTHAGGLSLSQGQALYPRWRPVPVLWTGSIPTMEPVPVQPVPTCPIKWDYKAVESLQCGRSCPQLQFRNESPRRFLFQERDRCCCCLFINSTQPPASLECI